MGLIYDYFIDILRTIVLLWTSLCSRTSSEQFSHDIEFGLPRNVISAKDNYEKSSAFMSYPSGRFAAEESVLAGKKTSGLVGLGYAAEWAAFHNSTPRMPNSNYSCEKDAYYFLGDTAPQISTFGLYSKAVNPKPSPTRGHLFHPYEKARSRRGCIIVDGKAVPDDVEMLKEDSDSEESFYSASTESDLSLPLTPQSASPSPHIWVAGLDSSWENEVIYGMNAFRASRIEDPLCDYLPMPNKRPPDVATDLNLIMQWHNDRGIPPPLRTQQKTAPTWNQNRDFQFP